MKQLFKSLFSQQRRNQPVKMATDMSQVKSASAIDTLIEANKSYLEAVFGATFGDTNRRE